MESRFQTGGLGRRSLSCDIDRERLNRFVVRFNSLHHISRFTRLQEMKISNFTSREGFHFHTLRLVSARFKFLSERPRFHNKIRWKISLAGGLERSCGWIRPTGFMRFGVEIIRAATVLVDRSGPRMRVSGTHAYFDLLLVLGQGTALSTSGKIKTECRYDTRIR